MFTVHSGVQYGIADTVINGVSFELVRGEILATLTKGENAPTRIMNIGVTYTPYNDRDKRTHSYPLDHEVYQNGEFRTTELTRCLSQHACRPVRVVITFDTDRSKGNQLSQLFRWVRS